MGYQIDKKMLDESQSMRQNRIEDIMEKNEKVIWEDRPKKSAFIWSKILHMLPLALVWGLVDGFMIGMMIGLDVFKQIPPGFVIFIVLFFALHLLPLWIWIAGIIKGVAEHKNIHYVLTNKRLIVRDGIIPDIKYFEYTSLSDVKCRVGIIDRILKVGDLYISAQNGKAVLFDISDPYRISSLLQRVITDIKTDIYYPNALRPDENPGYQSKYEPKA